MKLTIPALPLLRHIALTAIAFATISTASQAQECGAMPTPPFIPDGLEATEDELIAAVGEFQAYQVVNKEFMDCHVKNCPKLTKEDQKALDGDSAAKRRTACVAHDSAVDAEQNAGAYLNAQIKAFKSKPCKWNTTTLDSTSE